jgi:hypothetical protein
MVLNKAADLAHKALVTGLLAVTVVSGVFVFGSMGDIFKRSYERRRQQQAAAQGDQ